MPKLFIYIGLILLLCLLIPPAVIARVRATPNPSLPIHIIQDMAFQAKFKTQAVNPLFADRRTMRPPVENAVARGETYLDTHLYDGVINGQWAATLPAHPSCWPSSPGAILPTVAGGLAARYWR